MKIVTSGSRPISSDSGLTEIKEIVREKLLPGVFFESTGQLIFPQASHRLY